MFLSSLIEELCTKEENNKAGCALTFGGQCILYVSKLIYSMKYVQNRKHDHPTRIAC